MESTSKTVPLPLRSVVALPGLTPPPVLCWMVKLAPVVLTLVIWNTAALAQSVTARTSPTS